MRAGGWFRNLTAAVALTGFVGSARAEPPPTVVLVLMPNAGFRLIGELPTPGLDELARRGAAGFMNVRTVHGDSVDEAFLTIGAGNRANVSFDGEIGQSVNRDEPFDRATGRQVYERRTGFRAQDFRVLALNYALLAADSRLVNYDLRPGLLGDCLRRAGIGTAALGNADDFAGVYGEITVLHREAVGVVMDHLGRVLRGDVSRRMLETDLDSPHSRRLNVARVLSSLDKLRSRCQVFAVEDGELMTLQHSAAQYTARRYAQLQERALQQADELVAALSARLDFRRDLLIFCAPALEYASSSSSGLAPIIAAGPQIHGGWLGSASTRRTGLVVNTDIAPTVLAAFGLPQPAGMPGSPIRSVPVTRAWGCGVLWRLPEAVPPLAAVRSLVLDIDRQDDHRNAVERWFIYLGQIVVLLAAVSMLLPGWGLLWRTGISRWGFLYGLALPLAMLIEPFLRLPGNVLSFLAVALLTTALVACSRKWVRTEIGAVIFLAALNAAAVAVDLLSGQQGMTSSMLSYSPSEGARYYGIGNEYMGVLIGSTVTAVCLLTRSHLSRVASTVALAVMVLLICHPAIGAKAGGALVAIPAAGAAAWLLWGGRLRGRSALALAAGGVIALLLLALLDMRHGGSMTHIGKALAAVLSGGTAELDNIVTRKLLMEWRLLKYSPWSRELLASVISTGLLSRACSDRWRKLLSERQMRAALAGLMTATLTALLFNDAGVLAAALCFVYVPATLAAWLADHAADSQSVLTVEVSE